MNASTIVNMFNYTVCLQFQNQVDIVVDPLGGEGMDVAIDPLVS